MKLLYSHYGLYRKNGWGRTFEFAQAMAELGHEVTIMCSSPGLKPFFDSFQENGVKIVEFGDILPVKMMSSGYGILSLINRVLYCSFHHYDICHSDSHRDCGYIPCVVNRFLYKSRIIIDWWDNFEEKVKESPGKGFIHRYLDRRDIKKEISTKRKSDGVVVLSKLLYDRAKAIGIPSDHLLILHGGCDVKHIPMCQFNISKKLLGLPETTLTFGLIGMGDAEYNDIKYVLEAISELNNSEIKFINFGRPLVQALKKKPNLKSIIVEGGWVDYYKDATKLGAVDVFVLTKEDNIINNSGWPTKYGDYLACGRPVLLNLYGEIVSFNNLNNPGVIVVSNEKKNIKTVILDIVAGKFNLFEMGCRNREIANANSWKAKARELEIFYQNFIK